MSVTEDVGTNQGCFFHTLEIYLLSLTHFLARSE